MQQKTEVYGATGLLAPYIMKVMADSGFSGSCYSRTRPEADLVPRSFSWQRRVAGQGETRGPSAPIVVSCMPIWDFCQELPHLSGVRRVIVFSSTSVQSKAASRDLQEQKLSEALLAGERAVVEFCRARQIPWTILRPTLVYDGHRDENVTAIARFILRRGFFPVARPGSGLRQPVHALDLAQAVPLVLDNPKAIDQTYDLTGGETLTYRAMVERIFQALQRPCRILSLPPVVPEAGLKILGRFRKTSYSPELFRRMNQDLVFDSGPARRDFGYRPRPFEPDFSALSAPDGADLLQG